MARNLDITALRSFVAVADCGGVTRAAGYLNLTQSAVSMQLKRLEESLDSHLLDRSARTIALTASGEQLLSYARRMLELNDEVYGRLTAQEYEGEIVLGVPHDIVYPSIPQVLQQFHANFPRMRVNLVSSYTVKLKEMFARGEADLIMTTEDGLDAGGETIAELALVWIGAIGGNAWRQRPLRLAFEHRCVFRKGVQEALDRAGIPWEMGIESDQTRTIEASVSADLAVHAILEGSTPPQTEPIHHGGALPELAHKKINLYASDLMKGEAETTLRDLIRNAYSYRTGARLAAQ
ncbi:LysR family transcriptional regulator [Celeribacter baekdonensis]|uniref:LysR family transcriptional regulator n=1 Tax=Celeribacter baekdonensis TaxID=875171 RepID=A0A2R4M831_9RHOB|nr:LysR family transcriptional regulator [Celeribacter baekdonensis]AVW93298.1 LysR family transcriptional regulator [Celeribacter baekdonensis]